MSEYIIHNIILPLTEDSAKATDIAKKRLSRAGISPHSVCIYKRSVDMRRRSTPSFVYSVLVTVRDDSDKTADAMADLGFVRSASDCIEFTKGTERQNGRIGIVGFGPAGMFAALILAQNGYCPIVFERGGDIDSRVKSVDEFYKTHILNENCNIQFGAGGAGTFSDGKLLTRINDRYCRRVLSILHENGAPDSVLTDAKPHIGTDKLRDVVKNIAEKTVALGGRIYYNTTVTDITSRVDGAVVKTASGDFFCSSVILCPGHSARDTYEMLFSKGADMQVKPFSVGVRIEHRRQDIENALYGHIPSKYRDILPHAEYALSDRISGRGVYTFCMCPGGLVVPSSSECGGVVTNGMSYHSRSGVNSNSAVAVSVTASDIPTHPLSGIEFQRKIEQAAFVAGGGDYAAPYQTASAFISGTLGDAYSSVVPSYMDTSVKLCDIGSLFPDFITSTLRAGLVSFDKKIHGFASPSAVLTAPETRTSAPVRINRGENGMCMGLDNVYPCGEGAGYAGGITSAAVDGLKTAVKIMERFAPYEN